MISLKWRRLSSWCVATWTWARAAAPQSPTPPPRTPMVLNVHKLSPNLLLTRDDYAVLKKWEMTIRFTLRNQIRAAMGCHYKQKWVRWEQILNDTSKFDKLPPDRLERNVKLNEKSNYEAFLKIWRNKMLSMTLFSTHTLVFYMDCLT